MRTDGLLRLSGRPAIIRGEERPSARRPFCLLATVCSKRRGCGIPAMVPGYGRRRTRWQGGRVAARIETVSRVDEALGRAVDDLIQDVTAADGVPPVGEHKYLKLHHGAESVRAILAWDDDRL